MRDCIVQQSTVKPLPPRDKLQRHVTRGLLLSTLSCISYHERCFINKGYCYYSWLNMVICLKQHCNVSVLEFKLLSGNFWPVFSPENGSCRHDVDSNISFFNSYKRVTLIIRGFVFQAAFFPVVFQYYSDFKTKAGSCCSFHFPANFSFPVPQTHRKLQTSRVKVPLPESK